MVQRKKLEKVRQGSSARNPKGKRKRAEALLGEDVNTDAFFLNESDAEGRQSEDEEPQDVEETAAEKRLRVGKHGMHVYQVDLAPDLANTCEAHTNFYFRMLQRKPSWKLCAKEDQMKVCAHPQLSFAPKLAEYICPAIQAITLRLTGD